MSSTTSRHHRECARRRGAAIAEPSRLHGQCLRPHLGIIENTPGAEGPLSRRFGDWGLWLCGRANPSHARENWLAHASHLPNIPYLSCLLVLVPCLLLEAPSCSSLVGLSGPQDHFGCKWLPWGSPVRAPLATPVALPRAFMLIFIPRTRVQLCTIANSCTNSDFLQRPTRRCRGDQDS